MVASPGETFQPRALLAALQGAGAAYAVVGGLGRVLRGTGEVTRGIDICPALQPVNLQRVKEAVDRVEALREGSPVELDPGLDQVMELSSPYGEIKLVPAPHGVPRGFEALRSAVTRENVGEGIVALVASTADLLAMTAARGAAHDGERVRRLRRILILEAEPPALPGADTESQRRQREVAQRTQAMNRGGGIER